MKLLGIVLISVGVWLTPWYTPTENVILLALGLFFCMKADIQAVRAKEKP